MRFLVLALAAGCATTSNDVSEIHTTRKNNPTLAAQAALDDCGGPVKLVLTTAVRRPRKELVEITYRCTTADRPGYAPEAADQLIQQIAANATAAKDDEKRQILKIED